MPLSRLPLLMFLLVAPVLAIADEPAPPADVRVETDVVQAWGRDHADCAEWSDGCVACTKEGCSTPVIACTPQEIVCRRK